MIVFGGSLFQFLICQEPVKKGVQVKKENLLVNYIFPILPLVEHGFY